MVTNHSLQHVCVQKILLMQCKKCGAEKPDSEFYRYKNGSFCRICKECYKKRVAKNKAENAEKYAAYSREYYAQHKSEAKSRDAEYRRMVDELKTPCVKCGEKRLYVIDFHHIDPAEKSFNINRKTAKRNFSIIEDEAKKCVCLCRNCHMEFHYLYGMKPPHPAEALQHYLHEKEN